MGRKEATDINFVDHSSLPDKEKRKMTWELSGGGAARAPLDSGIGRNPAIIDDLLGIIASAPISATAPPSNIEPTFIEA